MKDYIEERAVEIAYYIIENKATVRQTAKKFGMSKSTIHKDVTERLLQINPALASHGGFVRLVKVEDHDVYVINPDGLTILQDELIRRGDIDVFCIDELATFRNGSAVRELLR